ncbi:FAD binding domain family protein [Aspergillus niger]|uniref:FAD binding domain family protein n=1 Tax=Aspergillus niger TaxID=5061 RepID=A0A505II43_ASPNG|nr:FAD binding domain family protein [Aspergillus niger]
MASVTSLDKDLRSLRLSRYTPQAAAEVRDWIEEVLHEKLQPGDLLDALKDGVALCRLVNLAVSPGVKYKQSSMPFVQMENISHFLRACQMQPISLPPHDVFLTVDLYEAKDPAQVLQCLTSFSRRANALQPSKFPRALGPQSKAATLSPHATGSSQGAYTPTKSSVSGHSSPARSPKPVSSWSKKSDEFATAPAWNIHQYGYMGGANQGNQGVAFGARRQITTAAPREERRWEEETNRLREKERRQVEEERKRWDAQQRKWEEEERQRQREEKETEDRLERERLQRREAQDSRLNGQFLSQYQASLPTASPVPPVSSENRERQRIRELERELERAKERERQYERERQDIQERATKSPPRSPRPAQPSYDLSSLEQERRMLRTEWQKHHDEPLAESDIPPSMPPRPLPEPVIAAGDKPPTPPRPLPDPTEAKPPMPPRPLPDPTSYTSPPQSPYTQESRVDRFLASNRPPVAPKPVAHRPQDYTTTAEVDAENSRRAAAQEKTKAGGWASN